MEVIVYLAILLTGIVFGSFFTLAVYRIPRHEDIVFERSHCTSCQHKLGFWDLIPIFSYLFLKGKCRYCGEKIRIRYLLLELFSGFVFLAMAFTRGINDIIELCFIYFFVAGMFIIAGINKENFNIPNGLCIYEFCVALVHFIWIVFSKHIYLEYAIGAFVIPLTLYLVNYLVKLVKKDNKKIPFKNGIITYLFVIGLMFGWPIQFLSIVLTIIIGLLGKVIHHWKQIPWGYYLTIATIMILIVEPYLVKMIEGMKV